jgi:hypothetical protein
MSKPNIFIISFGISAWCGYASGGQAVSDGKSVVSASPPPKCVRVKVCAPPPRCVPLVLVGPPPLCLVPPPVIYCEHPVEHTTQVRVPDEVHAYDIGRLPVDGGMHEAHIYYRIVQSAHWDLRLPASSRPSGVSTGPRGVFYPPTYQAPPRDQRVRDAVAAADRERLEMEAAQENFNNATADIKKKLQEDNQLKDEIQNLLEQNQRLRDQLQQKQPEARPGPSPTQSSSSPDALKQWGNQLTHLNGPSPAVIPTE